MDILAECVHVNLMGYHFAYFDPAFALNNNLPVSILFDPETANPDDPNWYMALRHMTLNLEALKAYAELSLYLKDDFRSLVNDNLLKVETVDLMLTVIDAGRMKLAPHHRQIVDDFKLARDRGILPHMTYRYLRNGQSSYGRQGYVYLLQSPTEAWKIGRSKDPADRMATFAVKLPFEVEYETTIKVEDMCFLEDTLHRYYEPKRINGEWFALDDDDVAYIKSLATMPGVAI